MKKLWNDTQRIAPAAAIVAGLILLLGVLLSFRFLAAMLGVVLIGWGICQCRS